MAEVDLEYDFMGARLRKIGAFDVEYDWMGTRLRSVGPYNIDYDWGGSRVRDVGPMKLEYSRGGQTPQRVTVPDEDAALPEAHLIVLFHILIKVQTGDKT